MSNLATHPRTAAQLDGFLQSPSHALLLHAPTGSGKMTVALDIAAHLLAVEPSKLRDYPYLQLVGSDSGKAISIEEIRKLEHFLSLRVPKPGQVNRIIIIEDAHLLTHEAQNALLKTLEEPPAATVLVLTATSDRSLLPTIRSRVQAIALKRPSQNELMKFFEQKGHSPSSTAQAYAISGGLPGLMEALLNNHDHSLQPATQLARELLQKSSYQRLLLVDELAKQKTQLPRVLFILQQMAHAQLQTTVGAQFKRWQQILTVSYAASEQLSMNAQPKLVLDQLMLNLG